jgi:hypothetical protein
MSMRRAIWLAAVIALLAIATAFVVKRYSLGEDGNDPRIIFERADRPAKA